MQELKDAICELVSNVEDILEKNHFEELDNAGAEVIGCLDELAKYRAVGTIEEFETLKKKEVLHAEWMKNTVACKFCGYKHLVDEKHPLDKNCHGCGRELQ